MMIKHLRILSVVPIFVVNSNSVDAKKRFRHRNFDPVGIRANIEEERDAEKVRQLTSLISSLNGRLCSSDS
jgi:hypothetical protein